MLGLGLVAYIFHEMDERSKDVPRTKVERNVSLKFNQKRSANSYSTAQKKNPF